MGIGTIGEYIPIISLAMSYPIYYNMYRYYYYYTYRSGQSGHVCFVLRNDVIHYIEGIFQASVDRQV